MLRHALAAGTLLLAGCMTPPPPPPKPAPILPEATFPYMRVEQVRTRLMDGCYGKGFMVFESAMDQVVCGATLEDPEARQFRVTGTSPHALPEQKIRFVLQPRQQHVFVKAEPWVENLLGTGMVRADPIEQPQKLGELKAFLVSLGAR